MIRHTEAVPPRVLPRAPQVVVTTLIPWGRSSSTVSRMGSMGLKFCVGKVSADNTGQFFSSEYSAATFITKLLMNLQRDLLRSEIGERKCIQPPLFVLRKTANTTTEPGLIIFQVPITSPRRHTTFITHQPPTPRRQVAGSHAR